MKRWLLAVSLSFFFLLSFVTAIGLDNPDIPLVRNERINYSTIPTVNNSEYFDGYSVSSLWTYYTGLGNALWCQLTGCTMAGDINMDGNDILEVGQFTTAQNGFTWEVTDDGSNIFLDFPSIGGANYLSISTNGANSGFFQLYANPNPSNDYLLATITETQGADTEINFYEGGTGHNRFWSSGSVRIGGGADSLCSNLTSDVDCNTPLTGADLVVQDDIWAGGDLYVEGNSTYFLGGNITFNGTDNIWDFS